MKDSQERLEALVRRGSAERRVLTDSLGEIRDELERRRTQLRVAGWVAGIVAAGLTAAYKLFGKGSPAAKIGRYASAASLLLGLGRAAARLGRLLL